MESAHQISELVESKAVIRYNSAIKSEWRIEFDSRTFEILAILDFEERKVYQTLYLAEVK